MVRLEQIQLLEKKINKAVDIINILKQENRALKSTIQKSQDRMAELENLLEQFKGEQNRIEEGILSALNKLDQLEDQVSEGSSDPVDSFEKSLPSHEPVSESSVEESVKAESSHTVKDHSVEESVSVEESTAVDESVIEEDSEEYSSSESYADEEAVFSEEEEADSERITFSEQDDDSPSVDMFGNSEESDTEDEETGKNKSDVELDIF